MKKGVILLITLFFILSFSILILNTLDNTNNYIEKQNLNSDKLQLLLAVKNIKDEVEKNLINFEYKSVSKILDNEGTINIPINIEKLDIIIEFKKFSKRNINDIINDKPKDIEQLLNNNGIYDFNILKEIIREKNIKKIITTKQLDDIILTFNKQTDYDSTFNFKESISFFDTNEVKYDLIIEAKYNNSSLIANYLLDTKGKAKYFEVSFK